jgi:hypothetical protein
MILHTNKTDRLSEMRTTSDQITNAIAKTTRTNAPAMIVADLNTAQHELLRLHETYAHADMKESRIPKCLSCSENKVKKRSHHKKYRESIT